MAEINRIVDGLTAWLAAEQTIPPLREITTSALLPATAYPQALLLLDSEEFGPGTGDVTAGLRLRLSCAAGRAAAAAHGVRELAQQVRGALNRSHGLGGLVKQLQVAAVNYGEQDRRTDGGVVATAELELTLRYCITAQPA